MARLREAFAGQGVDPDRLIFATRVPTAADHLARYARADLALDSYPYGSHTTSADALFGGCPILTLQGKTFAARVSSSIVTAHGPAPARHHERRRIRGESHRHRDRPRARRLAEGADHRQQGDRAAVRRRPPRRPFRRGAGDDGGALGRGPAPDHFDVPAIGAAGTAARATA